MKQLIQVFVLLSLFPILLSSTNSRLQYHSVSRGNHFQNSGGSGVLLVYTGSVKSAQASFDMIGVHIEMEPSIGIRYEWTFERGDNVVSHTALFYKFSKPNQSIIYDFLTHSSEVINNGGDNEGGVLKVEVVGNEMIGKYSCIHLQDVNQVENSFSRSDYWMDKDIPGFQKIINALNKANAGMSTPMLNETVFKWGGLARWKYYGENKKFGIEISADLSLQEANPNMDFSVGDFDPPKK